MDKRFLTFVLASMAVTAIWLWVVVPRLYPRRPGPETPPTNEPAADTSGPAAVVPDHVEPAPPTPPVPPPPAVPVEEAEPWTGPLETDRVRATFDNQGARMTTLAILQGPKNEWIEMLPPEPEKIPEDGPMPGAFILAAPDTTEKLERRRWHVEATDDAVTFSAKLAGGIDVRKRFSLRKESAHIDVTLELANPTEAKAELLLRLDVFDGIEHDGAYKYDQYLQSVVADREGALSIAAASWSDVKKAEDDKKPPPSAAKLDWLGLRNRYFALLAWPRETSDRAACQQIALHAGERPSRSEVGRTDAVSRKNIAVALRLKPQTLEGKSTVVIRFECWAAPLRSDALETEGKGIEGLVDYGWFDIIGRIILWLMNAFHSLVRNYGVAILLTTVTVRLCIFPLTRKSQVSMAKMQKLQPQQARIRTMYKDNPQKMNQEVMKLFKENGVSPMSGCLPMLLQLPIFIALYRVVDQSIDLRAAPFFAWIRDLSQPDRLVSFSTSINLFSLHIDALNVLPLVMTVTWVVQSFLQPKADDPQMRMQQKMMMFMPVMFGFICYGLASGLSLYLFTNSLLAIAEQKLIKKYFLPKA